ncbi:MAG: hypothetical protein JO167_00245 [Alphaproteobacteria bacterium]|nr:hypothetical protein [Alphaproteobacteria bacterium]MBV9905220.1 hypothetical protein [Alphaproteobacteria bacterium]
MKPNEQQSKDGQKTTSEYDVDKKRAREQPATRQDVEHDEIDTKTGEYAQKQKPH